MQSPETVSPPAPVLVIGPFPPPMHGFAEITRALAAHLETHAPDGTPGVVRLNTASNRGNAVARHGAQIGRNLWAGLRVLGARRQGHRVLSLGCNAGLGIAYTLYLALCARAAGLDVALHHHSYAYLNRRSRLMAALCRMAGPRLTHVCLAEPMLARLRAVYAGDLPKAARGMVLPNAIFVPQGGDKPPVPVDRPITLGLLSNLDASKGLHDFVATARALHASDLAPRVRMVLAGPIRQDSDLAMVKAAQAQGVLDWQGPQYGPDKRAFFDRLDLFLFPTRYVHEAQPTVIYEALASGVPVMAFDRGSIADQVRDCLEVVPQEADFAEAVTRALAPLAALDGPGWEALRARAYARHRQDIDQGRATIAALFYAETETQTARGPAAKTPRESTT